jgi:hypothetical protein
MCEGPCAEVGVVATSGPTEALTDLDRLPLDTQSFVLVARHDVNLPAGHDDLKMSDLRGLPLVAGQPGTGMRRVADAIIAATDCRIVVEIEHREGLLPLVLSGVVAARGGRLVVPTGRCRGPAVRRLAVEDELDVALVWQRHRLSPAAAAFVAVAEGVAGESSP